MIYQADLYIETKEKKYLFGLLKEKPRTYLLSTFLVEADCFKSGMVKVDKQIEKYKSINPKFFKDKVFKPFLTSPK